ncbi:MAG TPA: hypothetical protein VEA59_00525 [Patescibacteria group bacterium]|nr:hypothetical protein [Patescibacteria group bacterium]
MKLNFYAEKQIKMILLILALLAGSALPGNGKALTSAGPSEVAVAATIKRHITCSRAETIMVSTQGKEGFAKVNIFGVNNRGHVSDWMGARAILYQSNNGTWYVGEVHGPNFNYYRLDKPVQ